MLTAFIKSKANGDETKQKKLQQKEKYVKYSSERTATQYLIKLKCRLQPCMSIYCFCAEDKVVGWKRRGANIFIVWCQEIQEVFSQRLMGVCNILWSHGISSGWHWG